MVDLHLFFFFSFFLHDVCRPFYFCFFCHLPVDRPKAVSKKARSPDYNDLTDRLGMLFSQRPAVIKPHLKCAIQRIVLTISCLKSNGNDINNNNVIKIDSEDYIRHLFGVWVCRDRDAWFSNSLDSVCVCVMWIAGIWWETGGNKHIWYVLCTRPIGAEWPKWPLSGP